MCMYIVFKAAKIKLDAQNKNKTKNKTNNKKF